MQIVIDIPEMAYNLLKSDATIDWLDAENILNQIVEGIVLPKGHGDLIDRSKITFDNWSVHGHTCVIKKDIFNMPVIVPADKESEDSYV